MGKFQLNKKGEDPLKIYEDVFKIANDTVETHLGKLGKMPKPISESKASGTCPNCGSSDVDDGEDYGYDKDGEFPHLAGKLYQCNNCGKKLNGESRASEVFSPSDEEVLEYIRNNPSQNGTGIVTGMGWDGVEETDVGIMRLIDAGKIETQNGGYVVNESKASEWESVEAIASEYTSHKYDKEIQQTLDNIAKKQAEYTRECPDGCGKKFNTIDDNAVAYHLYHDHGYSSEDSRKSAGLE